MRNKSTYERFPIVKRGYDPETVESHLSTVADENDRILDEAAAQIAALQTELEESGKNEEAVHLTILAATKTKQNMLEIAQGQADEARAIGRKQGDGIITDARMQAFQVVTEARKEADGIVAEARFEAAALLRSIEASVPAANAPSEREIALQQRIEEMQNVIAAMESELHSRPHAAHTADFSDSHVEENLVAPPTIEATVIPIELGATEEVSADAEPEAKAAEADIEEHLEIVVTDTTPIVPVDEPESMVESADVDDADPPLDTERSTDDGSITDDRTTDAVRLSFYSRRSAKLPRIGVEAGRGAMAAAAGLRTGLTSDESKNKSTHSNSSQ
ncbi:MAG: DivIVA domain-containing protein, partial [Acidimicrobiia bacterium]|nr:DivIVA domain-containing protein [Acidimicrobiia bacterium]